ncbi:MAG: hypothetical protein ACREA0_11400, partial [bacterium]
MKRPSGLGLHAVQEDAEEMGSNTGFVTGSARWVEALQAALQDLGVQVRGCDDPDGVDDACAPFGSDPLDCYIQAPYEVTVGRGTDVERLCDLLAGGLLARIRTAAMLIPRLRADATVVLVADDRLPDNDVPDDPNARFDLLRVLGEAIRAEHAARRVVVMGSRCSVTEIVESAVPGSFTPEAKLSRYATLNPDMSYANWKEQLFSLTSKQDWERAILPAKGPVEYLGWVKRNGERVVVIRRETV